MRKQQIIEKTAKLSGLLILMSGINKKYHGKEILEYTANPKSMLGMKVSDELKDEYES